MSANAKKPRILVFSSIRRKDKTGGGTTWVKSVQDAVSNLLQLIKTYKSSHTIIQVITSQLFKHRKEQLEAVVKRAMDGLNVSLVPVVNHWFLISSRLTVACRCFLASAPSLAGPCRRDTLRSCMPEVVNRITLTFSLQGLTTLLRSRVRKRSCWEEPTTPTLLHGARVGRTL